MKAPSSYGRYVEARVRRCFLTFLSGKCDVYNPKNGLISSTTNTVPYNGDLKR